MKKIIIFAFCLFFFKISYSSNPGELNKSILFNTKNNPEITLSTNYQQFKFQVVNFETQDFTAYASLIKKRKKNDNLMLYVAGGLAVATATLILVNDPENFTTNSTSGVNLGIAVGGTVACGLIVTKYFVDKGR
ncbi:hypothetical protein ACFLS4_02295 [Bacteroidota bacterium]